MSASPAQLTAMLTADFKRVAHGGSFVSSAEVPALLKSSLNRDPRECEVEAVRQQLLSKDGHLSLGAWLQVVGARKECKGSVNFDAKAPTRCV